MSSKITEHIEDVVKKALWKSLCNAVMIIDNIIENTQGHLQSSDALTEISEIILPYVGVLRALSITTCKEIDRMKKSALESESESKAI